MQKSYTILIFFRKLQDWIKLIKKILIDGFT